MPPWSAAKAKVQLRLSVQRLRTLQQKKEAQAKASRRDIASLLERGKVETARIKVETIINEDIHVELLELLELYSELLLARFGLLDQNTHKPDPAISEAVCAIIHAAPHTELKELQVLRDILMHKYGREFSQAVMEDRDLCVSERVTRKLGHNTPSPELVDAYLTEIAKGYGVDWAPKLPAYAEAQEETGAAVQASGEEEEGKESTTAISESLSTTVAPAEKATEDIKKAPPYEPEEEEDEFTSLTKRFAALKKR
ncbi:DUF292-domain-containing protein [Roridomyces roridus]|uniref:DUF292-domain-containing protein n=1 Tax=Roridomyces roridus TaxID=1738132 RepID=A0AAD7FBW9_9AGAR|nr:DUF292-domain-containing protein [Roridomyces roridus]